LCYTKKREVNKIYLNRKENGLLTEPTRFEKLALLIDGIHKSIHKMKVEAAPTLGVKAVHVFWVYELMIHPEGLTAAELATKSMIDRSLVSREIEALKKSGFVESDAGSGKRNYNARIFLTKSGLKLAERIVGYAKYVQSTVDLGISEQELESFYSTLTKLCDNFTALSREFIVNDKLFKGEKQ
jgi:DNA-binding MarR family transcriptional regulator